MLVTRSTKLHNETIYQFQSSSLGFNIQKKKNTG